MDLASLLRDISHKMWTPPSYFGQVREEGSRVVGDSFSGQ